GEFVFGCGIRLLAQRPRTRDELQGPVRRLPRAKFVMPVSSTLGVSPGVTLWPGFLDRAVQLQVVAEVGARTERAPFYRPRMPRSGKPFSVEETNFGSHGWFSDESGYRYMAAHPVTKLPWPEIPELLVRLWHAVGNYAAPPECCLVNLYRANARMGLHQDCD